MWSIYVHPFLSEAPSTISAKKEVFSHITSVFIMMIHTIMLGSVVLALIFVANLDSTSARAVQQLVQLPCSIFQEVSTSKLLSPFETGLYIAAVGDALNVSIADVDACTDQLPREFHHPLRLGFKVEMKLEETPTSS